MIIQIINYIKKDLYRYCGKVNIRMFIKHYIKSEGFRFSFWLRICYFLRKNKFSKYTIFPFTVLIYKHYKYKYGYDIPYSIDIGPGLLIFHINGIIFSAQSAGKNLTLSHCSTVGMRIKNGKKFFPKLGDNIYIAPGAKVIGDVCIGNNVAIGTNAVLCKSVEDNAVVVGIPGEIISYNGANEYVNYPIE